MSNNEFSDIFTTLLNSYNTQAAFGEQASKREIVLDEYEKSVLLTQAQDIIVKSYFDSNLNSQGQGFDDSTRRQVDFSSLIKVAELNPVVGKSYTYSVKGRSDGLRLTLTNNTSNPLTVVIEAVSEGIFIEGIEFPAVPNNGIYSEFIADKKMLLIGLYTGETEYNYEVMSTLISAILATPVGRTDTVSDYLDIVDASSVSGDETALDGNLGTIFLEASLAATDAVTFDERGILYKMPIPDDGRDTTDVLFILNEKLLYKKNGTSTQEKDTKQFVVVPINYKEYDREMSKPYAQPLKKQAWRLFQNISTGFDVSSELIPRFNISNDDDLSKFVFKIRYVRRPRPIILDEVLPEGLTIDGITTYSECELNPILHMDILNKAVELAITTRGGGAAPSNNERDGQAGRR